MKEEKSVQKSTALLIVLKVGRKKRVNLLQITWPVKWNCTLETIWRRGIYFEEGEEKKSAEEKKVDEKEESNCRRVAVTDWKSKMKQNLGQKFQFKLSIRLKWKE